MRKKRAVHKPKVKATPKSHLKTTKEDILIENFVGLQKAMTNLSIKFSEMSTNISKLLNIFEESAKILASTEKEVDKNIVRKIDSLLEQNKILAKGITIMDSKMKRQSIPIQPNPSQQSFKPVPQMPHFKKESTTPNNSNIPPQIPNKPKELPKI